MRPSTIARACIVASVLVLSSVVHAVQPGPDQVPALNIAEATLQGAWTRDGAQLVSTPGGKPAAITLGKAPAEEYVLRLSVQRVGGTGGLTIGFPCGVTRADAVIDGWNGSTSGLSSISGKPGKDNPSAKPGQWLAGDAWTPLTLRVTASGVTLTSDGRQVLAWKGDPTLLSSPSALVTDRQRVYLLLGDEQTSIRVKDVRFESLVKQEPKPRGVHPVRVAPASAAPDRGLPSTGSKWRGTRTNGQNNINVTVAVQSLGEDSMVLHVTDGGNAVWSWHFRRSGNSVTLTNVMYESGPNGAGRDVTITNAQGRGTVTGNSIDVSYSWNSSVNRGAKNQPVRGKLSLSPK